MFDEHVVPISDEQVLAIVSNTEDNTTERKVRGCSEGSITGRPACAVMHSDEPWPITF
jgi:hypothetical protein